MFLGILEILEGLCFLVTLGFLLGQLHLVLLGFLLHHLNRAVLGGRGPRGCMDTVCTAGLVLLWVHQFLEFLETLNGLAAHGPRVDPCEKRHHLVVLEILVALNGLVNQDSLGPPEALLHSSLGVLALLFFLASPAIQELL